MKFVAASFFLSLLHQTSARPTLHERADTCGDWDTLQSGPYTLYANKWGVSAATTAHQCMGIDTPPSSSSIAWHTDWTYIGGPYQVKSYTNIGRSMTPKLVVGGYKSISTSWTWSYTGDKCVGNAAYDTFTSSKAGDVNNEYEVMLWLGALNGAGPLSTGKPIATPTISGIKWNLHYGLNGAKTKVYSFVADGGYTTVFKGDIMDYYKYLMKTQGFPDNQYINSIGAGTEVFVGQNCKMVTKEYSLNFA